MSNPFKLIDARLSNIESLLLDIKHKPETPKSDPQEKDLMRLPDLCEKLGIRAASVYAMTSTNRVPFMKIGKALFFSRTEIDAWIKSGRRKTVDEIAAEVKAQASEMPRRPAPRPSVFIPEEPTHSPGHFRLFPPTPPINKIQGPK